MHLADYEAVSLIMYSLLFSIHFYHAQSSFLAPQTFNALFMPSINPSILFLAYFSNSHLSNQILLFSSPTGLPPFSPCVQTTSTYTALLSQLTLRTPHFSLSSYALLYIYSSDTSSPFHLISSSLLLPHSMLQPHKVQLA